MRFVLAAPLPHGSYQLQLQTTTHADDEPVKTTTTIRIGDPEPVPPAAPLAPIREP